MSVTRLEGVSESGVGFALYSVRERPEREGVREAWPLPLAPLWEPLVVVGVSPSTGVALGMLSCPGALEKAGASCLARRGRN